jgi:hypothetical protein
MLYTPTAKNLLFVQPMSEAERAEIRAYMHKVNNLPYRYKGRVIDNSSHFTSARITVVKSTTDATAAATATSAAAASNDIHDNAVDSKVRFLIQSHYHHILCMAA